MQNGCSEMATGHETKNHASDMFDNHGDGGRTKVRSAYVQGSAVITIGWVPLNKVLSLFCRRKFENVAHYRMTFHRPSHWRMADGGWIRRRLHVQKNAVENKKSEDG